MDANRLQALHVALPYIRAYRGRCFVVKLGGRVCSPGDALANVVGQIGVLHQLGVKVVVVHGGGDQLTALSHRMGCEPQIVAGRRVTDAQTLELAKMTFAGTVNTDVLAAMRRGATPGIGVSGVDAGLITVRRRPPQRIREAHATADTEVDFGFVGDVEHVDASVLERLLDANFVPVVSTLAADNAGQVYNVNADTIAARIAIALRAAKLFSITSVDGVMGDVRSPASLRPLLDVAELEELIRGGAIAGGMLPKLAACIEALRGGVPRVHVVNGTQPDTLLAEVFTNEGCGTLIVLDREAARKPAGVLA